MPHDFSIDKKAGIILVTVCGLVGVLLFIAGFLLGIQYRFSYKPSNFIAQSSPAKVTRARLEVPAAKPAQALPQAASAPDNPAQPVLTPTPLTQQPPAGTGPDAVAETGSAAPANQAGNSSSEAAIQTPATAHVAGSPPATPPATAQTASRPPAVGATALSAPPADEREYSIQIGAFLNPKNATRLAKDLQEKGYKAKVFIATDSKYQVWHTVRIGHFKNIEAASQEARLFRQSAHLLALVRPADSL